MLEVNIAGISLAISLHQFIRDATETFPFINQITFFRVERCQTGKYQETYDLISRLLLPGYQGEYKLVSPILLEEDIQELKKAFQAISQKTFRQKAPSTLVKRGILGGLSFYQAINQLMALFQMQAIINPADLEETLQLVLTSFDEHVVLDREKSLIVCRRYFQRQWAFLTLTLPCFTRRARRSCNQFFVFST